MPAGFRGWGFGAYDLRLQGVICASSWGVSAFWDHGLQLMLRLAGIVQAEFLSKYRRYRICL